ncbi:hypothetical protein ACOSP6_13680 [Tenacibaculum sp. MEBiC06402]|uniref:hypothetical protein n=1 Tax=unclassified Tenacibaculum TaxID=2635139 RepID=UPI003B9C6F55
MNLITKIFNLLSEPNDFKDNPYGWLTNQVGHLSLSFVLTLYLSLLIGDLYAPITIGVLWLIWEISQYKKSNNFIDVIEDLIFELGGVLIFINWVIFLPLSIVLLILCLIRRL